MWQTQKILYYGTQTEPKCISGRKQLIVRQPRQYTQVQKFDFDEDLLAPQGTNETK